MMPPEDQYEAMLSLFDSEIGVYPNCGCFVLMVAFDPWVVMTRLINRHYHWESSLNYSLR